MNQEEIQQAAYDEALVPTDDRVKIGSSNMRSDPTLTQKESTYQVILDIIKSSPCYNVFFITVDVPKIYMQRFWFIVKKIKKSSFYQFQLDDKKFEVDVELFWKILCICLGVPDKEFIAPPPHDSLVTFINELGYKALLKLISGIHGSYINTIKDDGVLGRLNFICKGELTQVCGVPIPDTMMNEEIENSEAYQTYLALSTGTKPLKKGIGKGGNGKRATATPLKKGSIIADDNIILDLEDALKLGNSISINEAEEQEGARWVHETHERLVTEKPTSDEGSDESDDEQEGMKLKGIKILSDATQLAADTQKSIKAIRHAYRHQQQTRGLSEGAGITPKVPGKSVSSNDEWVLINKKWHTFLLMRFRTELEKETVKRKKADDESADEDKVHLDDEVHTKEDEQADDEAHDDEILSHDDYVSDDDAKKTDSKKIEKEKVDEERTRDDHGDKGDQAKEDQFLNLSSDTFLVGTAKEPTDTKINSLLDSTLSLSIASRNVNHDKVLRKKDCSNDQDPTAGSDQWKKKRRKGKYSKPSKDKVQTGSSSKGKTQSKPSSTDKLVKTEVPLHEAEIDVEEPALDDMINDADQPQDDVAPKHGNSTWFKQPSRPPTLDLKWNKDKKINDGTEQTWFNDLVNAEKDPLTFNELMVTPIYFSKFAMNYLKLDKITKADLVGPVYKLLKETCKSSIELEYNMDQCYNSLTDQLDWKNPEGDRFPYELSKPLPLQGSPDHFTILVDLFFNNDLEYLRIGNSERKYTTSITKIKAAKSQINGFSKHDVYSTMKILSVVSVKVDKQFGYGYLQEIVVRRADWKLYTFKEGDFPKLHLNDIEDMLLLHVQNKLFNLDGDDVVDLAVALWVSLKLGHVTLTQKFIGNKAVGAMREYIRNVVKESRLVEKVKGAKVDLVIGSSGSIKMIKKVNFMRWNGGLVNEIELFEGFRREWKFSKEELRELIEKMCDDDVDGKVFKKCSAFILAVVVLIDEIFELFGIKEMEVLRWRSVLRLASRFYNKERMTFVASCASIAHGIFTGLIKWGEIGERNEVLLDDKDLEYIEVACLLHNIGLINGKRDTIKDHIILS
ncbi:hypothetical protein Tco_0199670 [Tanacetum coccineum]